MDSDSWARVSSYSRRRLSRPDVYNGEGCEVEEEPNPEYLCPFCAEDFDMVGLCCHIDEMHPVPAKNGVCPVCARNVGSDLVRHLTGQHAKPDPVLSSFILSPPVVDKSSNVQPLSSVEPGSTAELSAQNPKPVVRSSQERVDLLSFENSVQVGDFELIRNESKGWQ
ncbi:protein dehydration-induced 19 homolog 4 [Phtheirospermum japonicum]|uniref:Protein dehydration-induced 19 homolog 4 n=1 Tax=Phtheirospermum japonicum TaxID=374723 RepID=A0A830BJ41_9LAMI|nr:protein dehydration-induced 19 homolog 4 [Phtheirospermum japonicum]